MQSFTSGVGSETSNESGVGTRSTTGDCLVQTFSTGMFGVICAENCFARGGKTFDRGDEVKVAAAENHNFVCVRAICHVTSEPCRTETNTALT